MFIDKLIQGLTVSVIGIGITFIVMFALILLIYLTKYIFAYTNKPENNAKATPLQSQDIAEDEIDPETVAAISAAIACYYAPKGADAPRAGFIVRSIKKRI